MNEIVSFNEVRDLSSLLELDGAELDQVMGGVEDLASGSTCINYRGSCSDLTRCEGYWAE